MGPGTDSSRADPRLAEVPSLLVRMCFLSRFLQNMIFRVSHIRKSLGALLVRQLTPSRCFALVEARGAGYGRYREPHHRGHVGLPSTSNGLQKCASDGESSRNETFPR